MLKLYSKPRKKAAHPEAALQKRIVPPPDAVCIQPWKACNARKRISGHSLINAWVRT